MFEVMIQQCNQYICSAWNPGTVKHGSHQHRDLIRTFFAGGLVSLELAGKVDLAIRFSEQMAFIVDINWGPDQRFRVP